MTEWVSLVLSEGSGSGSWGLVLGSWTLSVDSSNRWDGEGLLLALLLGNGSLDLWVVLVGENSRDWGGNLSEWVSLIKSLLGILLSVNGSDGWYLEGLLLSLLSGNSSLEIWLIGVSRVEHSFDVGLSIWVFLLFLLSLGEAVVVMVLLHGRNLNSVGLETVEVDFVELELVINGRYGANKGSNGDILEH